MRLAALVLLLVLTGCAATVPRPCPAGYHPHTVRADGVSVDLGCWRADHDDAEPLVWLGSDEAQAGKAALVGAGLLTMPELPE